MCDIGIENPPGVKVITFTMGFFPNLLFYSSTGVQSPTEKLYNVKYNVHASWNKVSHVTIYNNNICGMIKKTIEYCSKHIHYKVCMRW